MKNFIAIAPTHWEPILGKFDKLKQALDCTARNFKKSNGQIRGRVIDVQNKKMIYFKNKEIKERVLTSRERKDYNI